MAGTPKANNVMISNLILTVQDGKSMQPKDALEAHHNPEQPIASLDTRLNEFDHGW